MSDFLHLKEYIQTAQEEDLFVIVRPGPFICAEFEFGGFPSWLLRDKNLEVRTSNSTFMKYVARFFSALLPILASLQFMNGGPVIMFQVENEYANSQKHDLNYLKILRNQMLTQGKYIHFFLNSRFVEIPQKCYLKAENVEGWHSTL